jgi:hypothetical protein
MSASAVSSTSWSRLNNLAERCERWLSWTRARAYSIGLCVIYLTIWLTGILTGQPPLSNSKEPIGGDYIAFYAAGRLILQGQPGSIYDRAAVETVQGLALGGAVPGFFDAFRNPPFFALVFAPIAALDLVPSFAVWSAVSIAMLAAALWRARTVSASTKDRTGLLLVGLGFPAVYFCLIDGQNSTLSLLLFVLIYEALCLGRDRRAGVLAALGLFKPQLFFLFPVLLLVAGRGRALIAYVMTGVGLTIVSTWLVGFDGMATWLRSLFDYEGGNAARNGWRMSSISTLVAQLAPGQESLALMVTLVLTVGLVAMLIVLWRRPRAVYLSAFGWSLTVLIATLVDPHLVDYDLTVLVLVGMLVLPPVSPLRLLTVLLYALMLTRPQIPLGAGALQPVPLVLLAGAFLVHRLGLQDWRSGPLTLSVRTDVQPG